MPYSQEESFAEIDAARMVQNMDKTAPDEIFTHMTELQSKFAAYAQKASTDPASPG